jgi:hypothetical protein
VANALGVAALHTRRAGRPVGALHIGARLGPPHAESWAADAVDPAPLPRGGAGPARGEHSRVDRRMPARPAGASSPRSPLAVPQQCRETVGTFLDQGGRPRAPRARATCPDVALPFSAATPCGSHLPQGTVPTDPEAPPSDTASVPADIVVALRTLGEQPAATDQASRFLLDDGSIESRSSAPHPSKSGNSASEPSPVPCSKPVATRTSCSSSGLRRQRRSSCLRCRWRGSRSGADRPKERPCAPSR